MANSNRISIVIDADGKAYVETVGKAGDETEKFSAKTEGVFTKLKAGWMGYSAAAIAAYMAIKKAWDLADTYAQYEEQKNALDSLSAKYHTTADSIIASVQTASKGMISMADAASVATGAIVKGLKPEQIRELAAAGETLSNVYGGKVSDKFRELSEAIALGKERALEASVGIIDLNASFGEQVNKMNDAEKAAARYNLVMEKVRDLQKQTGDSVDSTSDKMERFTVMMEDIKLIIGKGLVTAGAVFISIWASIGAAINMTLAFLVKFVQWVVQAIEWITRIIPGLGILQGIADGLGSVVDHLGEATKIGFEWGKTAYDAAMGAGEMEKKVTGLGAALDDTGVKTKQLSDIDKSLTEKIADLNGEYNKLTMTTEQYTKAERKELLAQGASLNNVIDFIAAKERLNKLKAAQASEKADEGYEKSIMQTYLATEKLGASKERLIELAAFEYSLTGANAEQVARYTAALEEQASAEKSLADAKDVERIKGERGRIEGEVEAFKMPGEESEFEKIQAEHEQKLEYLREYYNNRSFLIATSLASEAEQERMYAELKMQYAYAEQQVKLQTAAQTFGMLSNFMQNLYVATGSRNKAMFAMMKGFSIAQAIMNTAEGVTKAYAQGGFAGLVTGAIVLAAGMAQIAQIRAQQPGGATGTISAGGTANPSYSGGSPSAYPVPERQEEPTKAPVVNVHVYGNIVDHDKFAREMVPSIQKAIEDKAA